MKSTLFISGLLGMLASLAFPIDLAFAFTDLTPQTVIDAAAPDLGTAIGSSTTTGFLIADLFNFLAERASLLVTAIAIVVALIGGLRLAFSQSEEAVSVARRSLIGGIAAIVLVALAGIIQGALYTDDATNIVTAPAGAAASLCAEAFGIMDMVQIPLLSVAVMMIIINGIRAVVSYGSDDGVGNIRRTVISVIFGVTIIGIRNAIATAILGTANCGPLGGGDPDPIITEILAIVNRFIQFIALAAVVVIVIAGIMMVVNIGNDEQYTRARNLIVRVIIGILVIVISAALVNAIIAGLT